jgi:hypothetical protein
MSNTKNKGEKTVYHWCGRRLGQLSDEPTQGAKPDETIDSFHFIERVAELRRDRDKLLAEAAKIENQVSAPRTAANYINENLKTMLEIARRRGLEFDETGHFNILDLTSDTPDTEKRKRTKARYQIRSSAFSYDNKLKERPIPFVKMELGFVKDNESDERAGLPRTIEFLCPQPRAAKHPVGKIFSLEFIKGAFGYLFDDPKFVAAVGAVSGSFWQEFDNEERSKK